MMINALNMLQQSVALNPEEIEKIIMNLTNEAFYK